MEAALFVKSDSRREGQRPFCGLCTVDCAPRSSPDRVVRHIWRRYAQNIVFIEGRNEGVGFLEHKYELKERMCISDLRPALVNEACRRAIFHGVARSNVESSQKRQGTPYFQYVNKPFQTSTCLRAFHPLSPRPTPPIRPKYGKGARCVPLFLLR